jgi:hypothetical protein
VFDLRDAARSEDVSGKGEKMAPPVHGNAEPDLPDGVLYNLAVDADGWTQLRTDQDRTCQETMALMAQAANLGRERYEVIPRTRGSLEACQGHATAA